MCGRYILGQVDDLSERFQLRDLSLAFSPTWNAAPTQQLPVIYSRNGGDRTAESMRWGLLPRWKPRGGGRAPEPINARAETLAERPMFRSLIGRKRCIIPATGFYEWQQLANGKQPILIQPTDQELFGFAGLWDDTTDGGGEPVRSFTLITTSPNSLVKPIHDRMVAILEPDREGAWLDPDITDWPEVEQLITTYPAGRMNMYPVGKAVNNTRLNDPSLIESLEEASDATVARS
jgi:putative SOS response-associated peptidase YedK